MQELHTENYKTLAQKIKEDLNEQKTYNVHGSEISLLLRSIDP